MLNPPENGKIQGLFKAFECLSSTFQGKFNFQELFLTVLYIQVLFKSVRTVGIMVRLCNYLNRGSNAHARVLLNKLKKR